MTSLNISAKEFTPSFTLQPVLNAATEAPQASAANTRGIDKEGKRGPTERGGTSGKASKGRTPASSKQGSTHRSGDKQTQGNQEATPNKSKRDTLGKSRSQQHHQQSRDNTVQSKGSKDHDPHAGALASETIQESTGGSTQGGGARGSGSRSRAAQKNEKSTRQTQPAPPLNRSKSSSTSVVAPDSRDQRGAGGASTISSNKKSAPKQKFNAGTSSINRRSSVNPESEVSNTAGSRSGTVSNIMPGMEATTFICLTDVIHPVRHVVKDGISVMEQGSDAYLDWIARSLKEHEEITVIGMDAAIPDVISLVLRAGRMGIGYQEVRTFTTQDALGGNKSCLQFRMTRENGYVPLAKRPPQSSIN